MTLTTLPSCACAWAEEGVHDDTCEDLAIQIANVLGGDVVELLAALPNDDGDGDDTDPPAAAGPAGDGEPELWDVQVWQYTGGISKEGAVNEGWVERIPTIDDRMYPCTCNPLKPRVGREDWDVFGSAHLSYDFDHLQECAIQNHTAWTEYLCDWDPVEKSFLYWSTKIPEGVPIEETIDEPLVPACMCEIEKPYLCDECGVYRVADNKPWKEYDEFKAEDAEERDARKKQRAEEQALIDAAKDFDDDEIEYMATFGFVVPGKTPATKAWRSVKYTKGPTAGSGKSTTTTTTTYVPKCRHYSQAVILPDGTKVRCSSQVKREDDDKDIPDFGAYFASSWVPAGLAYWVPWTDHGLPQVSDKVLLQVFKQLYKQARKGKKVEIGCIGGHGRTGTGLACLAIMAGLELPEKDGVIDSEPAIQWVHDNYCKEAIEGAKQEWFIAHFYVLWNNLDAKLVPAPPVTTYSSGYAGSQGGWYKGNEDPARPKLFNLVDANPDGPRCKECDELLNAKDRKGYFCWNEHSAKHDNKACPNYTIDLLADSGKLGGYYTQLGKLSMPHDMMIADAFLNPQYWAPSTINDKDKHLVPAMIRDGKVPARTKKGATTTPAKSSAPVAQGAGKSGTATDAGAGGGSVGVDVGTGLTLGKPIPWKRISYTDGGVRVEMQSGEVMEFATSAKWLAFRDSIENPQPPADIPPQSNVCSVAKNSGDRPEYCKHDPCLYDFIAHKWPTTSASTREWMFERMTVNGIATQDLFDEFAQFEDDWFDELDNKMATIEAAAFSEALAVEAGEVGPDLSSAPEGGEEGNTKQTQEVTA